MIRLGFELAKEIEAIAAIQVRYRDTNASLADACLVRMSEIHDGSRVLTFDAVVRGLDARTAAGQRSGMTTRMPAMTWPSLLPGPIHWYGRPPAWRRRRHPSAGVRR